MFNSSQIYNTKLENIVKSEINFKMLQPICPINTNIDLTKKNYKKFQVEKYTFTKIDINDVNNIYAILDILIKNRRTSPLCQNDKVISTATCDLDDDIIRHDFIHNNRQYFVKEFQETVVPKNLNTNETPLGLYLITEPNAVVGIVGMNVKELSNDKIPQVKKAEGWIHLKTEFQGKGLANKLVPMYSKNVFVPDYQNNLVDRKGTFTLGTLEKNVRSLKLQKTLGIRDELKQGQNDKIINKHEQTFEKLYNTAKKLDTCYFKVWLGCCDVKRKITSNCCQK